VRLPRTFVFVDLSGFTDFTATRGDDASGELLARFRAVVREVASERGVRVAKWLGDGAMIVSVDFQPSVAAALDLMEVCEIECAPLHLRAGIASGRALLFEGDDYIGTAVNLAARLCDTAGAGQLYLALDGAGELPPGAKARKVEPITIRGFAEPIAVAELGGRVARTTASTVA